MVFKPDHISYSAIQTYEDCPRKYMFRYVMGLEDLGKAMPLVFGSAVHQGLAAHYSGKDYQKAVQISLMKDMKKGYLVADTARDMERIARVMYESLQVFGRHYEAVNIEKRVQVPLKSPITGEVLSVPLVAIIDLETKSGEVVDHKTMSAFIKSADTAQFDKQLRVYSMVYRQVNRRPANRLTIQGLLKRKTAGKTEYYDIEPDEMSEGILFEEIKHTLTRILENDFVATPSRMVCSMCPFNTICPSSKARKGGGKYGAV